MLDIIIAIIPVFSVIMLGHFFRKKSFPGGMDFWHSIDRLVYFILIPCLFFKLTYSADLAQISTLITMPAIILGSVGIITALMLIFRKLISNNGAEFSSMYQGSIRFNGYLSLSLTQILFGPHILVYMAVAFAVLVPILNLLSISILALYASDSGRIRWRDFFKRLATNPLILSCIGGILLNKIGFSVPDSAFEICDILSRAALPLGLLSVGAGIELRYLKEARKPIFISTFTKLILFVVLSTLIAFAVGIRGELLHLIILFSALPAPPSAYVLAKQMGGDVPTMSAIIVFQTLISALTMTIVMILANMLFPY